MHTSSGTLQRRRAQRLLRGKGLLVAGGLTEMPRTGVVVRIDWRRGPRELRNALDETRRQVMRDIGAEIARTAPHPNIAASVEVQRSQVKVTHPAARFWEVGVSQSWRGPPARLVEWAQRHGKTLREAFAVARAGIHIAAQPYIRPSIDKVMGRVGRKFLQIWGH